MEYSLPPVNGTPKPGVAMQEKPGIDLGRLLRVLMSRWYWIVLSFIISMTACYFYLKSTQPKFEAQAYLKYNTEDKQSRFPEAGKLLGNNFGGSEDYLAEVYSMKSFSVLSKALDTLGINLSFFAKEGLKDVNIYPQEPLEVTVLTYDIDKYRDGVFTIERKRDGYHLSFERDAASFPLEKDFGVVEVGDTFGVPGLLMVINDINDFRYDKVYFKYIDYWFIKDFSERLQIKEAERELPILRSVFTSNNAFFTRDFLSSAINAYIAYDLELKRLSSEQTIAFINDQVNTFEGLLRESSSRLEGFKKKYDLIDVRTSSEAYISDLSELRTRKYNLEIQARNIDIILRDLSQDRDVVSDIIGMDGEPDPLLSSMINKLNELRYQRRQQLLNYSPQSSLTKNLDEEIKGLKLRITENIIQQKQRNRQALNIIEGQLAEINTRIGNIPTAERDLVYLTSDVDVNKNIYNILLNKKLETSIEKAGVIPSFTVIDYPKIAIQTFPRPVLLTAMFAMLGIGGGIGLILLKRALKNKFSDMKMLDRVSNIPVLGVINHYPEDIDVSEVTLKQIFENRSVFTETVNAIRTNLAYLTGNGAKKVITITSEVSGEGKSFVSLNLAVSLTKLNKKVIIVACDLRRSKLHRYFNDPNRVGLSTYLADSKLNARDIVLNSKVPLLNYITSGPVPINPSELIYQERFWGLLEDLKKEYDFIILDTAPIGLVSDSIPILRGSDINIFVLRWLYSNTEACLLPGSVAEEFGLNNVYMVINDFKKDELYGSLKDKQYYGGYSKYYANYSTYYNEYELDSSTKKSWYRRLLKRWKKEM